MRINIYKREGSRGPRWYLDYFWSGRRWRYPVADTRDQAEQIKAHLSMQIHSGAFKGPMAYEQPSDQPWTFGRFCKEWYAIREPRIRPATKEYYQDILSVLRGYFGEDRQIDVVSPLDCRRCIAVKRAESNSPVRANRHLTVLRSLFAFAVEEELLDRDPTKRLRKEREPRKETFLDGDQLDAVLAKCDAWLRPIALTAYYTGARKGDLVGDDRPSRRKPPLTWADVDLTSRRITFQHTKERKPRTVKIGKELLSVLFALPSKPQGSERPEKKPVFLDDRGKPPTADRVYRRFRAAAKAAKVKGAERLRFHDLKHSTVSGLVAKGYSLEMIQAYVGHSTPWMTQRYAHIANEQLDAMADGLAGTIPSHADRLRPTSPQGGSGK
jgi:integrase